MDNRWSWEESDKSNPRSPHVFFQAEDGIRDDLVTGVQTCALPISHAVRLLAVDGERAAERGETAISSVGKLEFGEPAVGDGARPAGHVGHADAHANAARYVDIVSGHDILHGRWSGEEREQRQSYDACGFRHAHFPYAMPFAAALPC